MSLRSVTRAAVSSSLRLIRFPLDGALRLGGGSMSAARLAVDRVDAGVRGAAGLLLRDDVLIEDAELRRAAAKEREHAMRLRAEAGYRSDRGERKAEVGSQEASARRRQAKRTTQQKEDEAKKRRDARKSRAARAARSRKQAAEKDAQKREQLISARAERDRLKVLDKKSEALGEKEVAVATADEARRLKKAASAAKSDRRNSGGD